MCRILECRITRLRSRRWTSMSIRWARVCREASWTRCIRFPTEVRCLELWDVLVVLAVILLSFCFSGLGLFVAGWVTINEKSPNTSQFASRTKKFWPEDHRACRPVPLSIFGAMDGIYRIRDYPLKLTSYILSDEQWTESYVYRGWEPHMSQSRTCRCQYCTRYQLLIRYNPIKPKSLAWR